MDRGRQEGTVEGGEGGAEIASPLHFLIPSPSPPFFSPPFTSFSKYTSVKSGEREKGTLVEGAGGGDRRRRVLLRPLS